MVRELGAHEVVDYTTTKTYNAGGDYDVILDCVGGESPSRFTPWLTARGVYACTMPDARTFLRQFAWALVGKRRVRGVMLRPSGDDLRWLATLYAQKKLRVVIDEVFPLERLADAHRKSIAGRARGKIVVSVAA